MSSVCSRLGGRGLLERTCGDEEVLAKQGDVAGLPLGRQAESAQSF